MRLVTPLLSSSPPRGGFAPITTSLFTLPLLSLLLFFSETQISLPLHNKFEIQMSPVEREQNLKVETINELLYLFEEFPSVNGETLLEIFLLMKHQATVVKPKPSEAKKIDQVLANLETLAKAKGSKLTKKNGYNDFIQDIKEELLAKEKHCGELRHEIKQLTEANDELDQQKKKITEAVSIFPLFPTFLDFSALFETFSHFSQTFAPFCDLLNFSRSFRAFDNLTDFFF